jgi:hypothetical protein
MEKASRLLKQSYRIRKWIEQRSERFYPFLACNTVEQLAVGVDAGRVRLKPTLLRRMDERHFCPTTMSKTGSLPFCNAEGYPPIDFSCW